MNTRNGERTEETRNVSLQSIVEFVDRLLDVRKVPDREGNGLAVRSKEIVSTIGAAVNTSYETIRQASESGVDLLFVHHTSWAEIDLQLTPEKFRRLKDAGVSLYAAHESLDRASSFGTVDSLAALLGVATRGRWAEGVGAYGDVDVECFDDLLRRVKDALGVPVEGWHNNQECRNVAVLPGAAGRTTYLHEAKELGCDSYITGEGSMYTRLYAQETEMNLVLGGHHATEFPGIKALAERVALEFGLTWKAIPEDSALG